jgi:hypothetical protein
MTSTYYGTTVNFKDIKWLKLKIGTDLIIYCSLPAVKHVFEINCQSVSIQFDYGNESVIQY